MSAAADTLRYTNTRTGYVGADSTKRKGWMSAAQATKRYTDTRTGSVGATSHQLGSAMNAPRNIKSRIGSYLGSVGVNTRAAGNAMAGAYAVRDAVGRLSAAIRVFTKGSSANGNIYGPIQKFAQGGFANKVENHVAQIAQPGVRVWAEPETFGEAYIPLALSKRARSRQILQQTSKILGMTTPQPKEYVNGGVDGRTNSSSTSKKGEGVNITMNVVNGDKMDENQLGRAVSREMANRLR